MDNIFYCVYFHKRKDNHQIFYVGVGKKYRPTEYTRRNYLWNLIKEKYGVVSEVIHKDLSYEVALRLEKKYVKQFGRIDNGTGILANLTDGGHGIAGRIFSEEERAAMSARAKLFPIRKVSEETRKKISATLKGRKRAPLVIKMPCGANSKLAKKVIHIPSGVVYGSTSDAALAHGVNKSTLRVWLSRPPKKGCDFKLHEPNKERIANQNNEKDVSAL